MAKTSSEKGHNRTEWRDQKNRRCKIVIFWFILEGLEVANVGQDLCSGNDPLVCWSL